MNLKRLITISLMSAIMCVLGPLSISIPISPVPISFTNLVILFSIYILGAKDAAISYLLYLLIGFIGLPVFSGFSGGPSKLLGPTGGYLIGFIFMTLIAGFFINKFQCNIFMSAIGIVLGIFVLYIFGTAWLAYQTHMTFAQALMVGVVPFLIADVIKIIIVVIFGPKFRNLLIQNN